LRDVAAFLGADSRRGRENEVVNLYTFACLLARACRPGGPLDPTQLGIEVAVPQLRGRSNRHQPDVRKDSVIWRPPRATKWMAASPAQVPVL
jgi:hypothetical protein